MSWSEGFEGYLATTNLQPLERRKLRCPQVCSHSSLVLAISELKVPEKRPPKRQAVKENEWTEWNEWSEWHEWVESKPEKKQEKKNFKDCMHSESVIC